MTRLQDNLNAEQEFIAAVVAEDAINPEDCDHDKTLGPRCSKCCDCAECREIRVSDALALV